MRADEGIVLSVNTVCQFVRYRHTDFRELVRDLFAAFKTRIWMQKIRSPDASVQRPFHPIDSNYSLPSTTTGYLRGYHGALPSSESGGVSGYANGIINDAERRGDGRRGLGSYDISFGSDESSSGSVERGVTDSFYQQLVPGTQYQFGGSMPPSPAGTRNAANIFSSNLQQERPVCLTRGSRPHLDRQVLQEEHIPPGYIDVLQSQSSARERSGPHVGHALVLAEGDCQLTTWMTSRPYESQVSTQQLGDSEQRLSGPEEREDDFSFQLNNPSTLSVTAKPFVYRGTL